MSPNHYSNNSSQRERTPIGQFVYMILTGFGAYKFHQFGLQGFGFASVIAIVLTIPCVLSCGHFIRACYILRDKKQHAMQLRRMHDKKGKSRFATIEDCESGGYASGKGIPVGWLEDRLVSHDGEASMAIFGPPGTCKTSGFVIPYLLTSSVSKDEEEDYER